MQRISPLGLVGRDCLDFNIYDVKGEIVYKKGERLSPEFLLRICNVSLFIKEIEKEKEVSKPTKIDSTGTLKHKAIFSEEVVHTLTSMSRSILKNIYNKENGNSDEHNEAANLIINEVNTALEKIFCISQFKVFDEYIFSHTINVASMTCALAVILGLDSVETAEITLGALLHDTGKMFVPKGILNKPAKLNPEEYDIMKTHSLLGYRYVKDRLNLPDRIAKVALDHQEYYGGGGYPNNLKGKEINLGAQITSVIDVYDALTSNKVYKRAVDSDSAIDIMIKDGEKRFNPYILSKFLRLVDYKNKKRINVEDKDII